MTIILLCAFLVAVLIVQWMAENRQLALKKEDQGPLAFSSVRGVSVSKNLAFHPCHTWLRRTDAQSAAVGLDDFARRIIGPVDRVVLPMEGARVSEGETCAKIISGQREVAIVAPVSGEVFEINKALLDSPQPVFEDAYGEGWLFRIRSWRLMDQEVRMIRGARVLEWMDGAVSTLVSSQPSVAGVVAQDGGYLSEQATQHLDQYEWIKTIREHLGTEPRIRQ